MAQKKRARKKSAGSARSARKARVVAHALEALTFEGDCRTVETVVALLRKADYEPLGPVTQAKRTARATVVQQARCPAPK